MSGTRSPSPKARATEAPRRGLLIAAHGDRGGSRSNSFSRRVASMAERSGCFAEVAIGYLRDHPDIGTVAARIAAREVVVYPLFMSDGYYVRRAIPRSLGLDREGRDRLGRDVKLLAAVGRCAGFPDAVAEVASAAAARAGQSPGSCRLLLVAHGSGKDPASRETCREVKRRLAERAQFAGVELSFLAEAPRLEDQLAALAGPLVVVGLFVGDGLHGGEDLVRAVRDAGREDLLLSQPLSSSVALERLAAAELGLRL